MNKIPLEMIGEETEIRFRDCFSVRYLQAAALLCRLGYALEKDYGETGAASEDAVLMHEAFILNAILSSVSFLESTVNELYSDATDRSCLPANGQAGAVYRAIAEGWNNAKNFDRAPVLAKYQKILSLASCEPFAESDPAYANVQNIILIRNFLLHYRKEWVIPAKGRAKSRPGQTEAERIDALVAHAFRENPFAGRGLPFFPGRCLGHGCAEWAVLNSLILADAFFSRLDLPPPYDGIRAGILTR